MLPGIHFNDTYAPVVQLTTFRFILAITTKFDWEAKQGDAPTAFMQSDIDTTIYTHLSPAFRYSSSALREAEKKYGRCVALVAKGLPGIPQGSRLWNHKLHGILTALGFTRSKVDYGLYFLLSDVVYILILLWVDDVFMFFPSKYNERAATIWSVLRKEIHVGEWEELGDCLGCNITRDRQKRRMFLSQGKAIQALAKKLGLDHINVPETPMEGGLKISKADCLPVSTASDPDSIAEAKQIQTRYRSMTMSMNFFCQYTRPDIAYAVNAHARVMHNPGEAHQKSLKRLLRHTLGTHKLGLLYDFSDTNLNSSKGLYGYYDASHASCPDTKRSTLGYIFYWNGCPISWSSRLHPYITSCTNHSEYVAGSQCAKEASYLRNLCSELGLDVCPITLFSDSSGAISQTYNPGNRKSTKHIDLADHYIREQVELRHIDVQFANTKNMNADLLTKALGRQMHSRFSCTMVGSMGD